MQLKCMVFSVWMSINWTILLQYFISGFGFVKCWFVEGIEGIWGRVLTWFINPIPSPSPKFREGRVNQLMEDVSIIRSEICVKGL